jgi:hypothetical protein
MPEASTIGLIAGSSVVAATLTQSITVVRDWFKRKRDAGYSALYAALALEDYARECSIYVSDSELWSASEGFAGQPRGRLPAKPSYRTEIDWNSIGVKETTKCLSLLVEIEMADQKIASTLEFGDDEDGIAEMRWATVNMGIKAFKLAKRLRSLFGVKKLKLDKQWNFMSYLTQQKNEYEANREKARAMMMKGKLLPDDVPQAE